MVTSLQYGIPVIKYDRKGFKARQRQLILTQKAAYVVELAKIKQKIEYSALKGKRLAISRQLTGLSWLHVSHEAFHWKASVERAGRAQPGPYSGISISGTLPPPVSRLDSRHLPQ